MGGGSHSVDSAGAAQAKQQELAVQQKQLGLATEQQGKQNALYATLFGNGKAGGGGALSQFLDPNSLNVTNPTGVYGRQLQEANQETSNDAKNERASEARSMASRGFGSSPAMFGADQQRQSRLAAADAKGRNYTDAVGKQYHDALSNFWNATGVASDTMRGATGAATQNYGNVGSTAASMYNGGNQQVQNSNLLGNIVGAGGQVAGAAMMCPASGALISMQDGTVRLVEEVKKGDEVLGIDGQPCRVIDDPLTAMRECVIVRADEHKSKVAIEHTFALVGGGYDYAKSVAGKFVMGISGMVLVNDVRVAEPEMVYYLPLDGSHTYCADGLWALA
jgi:hypothetical protein